MVSTDPSVRRAPRGAASEQRGVAADAVRTRHTIYLIDDHRFFVSGLSSLINQTDDLTVCGSSDDPARAVREVERLRPDLVVIDVNLHHNDGMAVATRLRRARPKSRILFLSSLAGAAHREQARHLGAVGFLEKTQEPMQILAGIRKALAL